jgi:hypothetical protein
MDPTEETLDWLFRGNRGSRIVVINVRAPIFLEEGLRFAGGGAVIVSIERTEEARDLSLFDRFGEFLAPTDYRIDCVVHDELRRLHQPAFPQPPRSLGRSIPARQTPFQGTRLTCGGWR